MAKENEFVENLQKSVEYGVLDNRTELEKKRDDLMAAIAEMEENVIKDPRALENLKKELVALNKQIDEEKVEKAVETGAIVGEEAAEKDVDGEAKKAKAAEEDEKTEEIKDENALNEEEQKKEQADMAKQAYHDAMITLHEQRMAAIRHQKELNQLVISDDEFKEELRLESEMYRLREAYLAYGDEDPYREKRTELIKKEKEAKESIEMQLRNMAKRFKEIEEEIKKIDKREQEISEELLDKDINETKKEALTNELAELEGKRKELELERAEIRLKLNSAIETRRERTLERAGLDQKHVETLTYDDKRNYEYQKEKVNTMNNNFDEATKQHYKNIKIRIEQREQRIKDLNKELKEVPETDFERRLILLNELDKETNMLQADRKAKSDLDRGIIPKEEIAKKEINERSDDEEYRQEEFAKATDEARAVVAEQKEEIGEAVVENPDNANMEETDRDATLAGAAVAVAYDSPEPGPDTPLQDVGQYAVTKCVIEGLEDKVRDPNNPEDAKAIVEHDEQLKEADHELDKVQEKIEART